MKTELKRSSRAGVILRACCNFCVVFLLAQGALHAQEVPDVRCNVENYVLGPGNEVQVVVLRDPSGQQEARFDLTHGAGLVSLRYDGKEVLFGHNLGANESSLGANVSMYKIRHGTEEGLTGFDPFGQFQSAFLPNQGWTSMDVPSTVAGVACRGGAWMNAFAMLADFGADESFERHPLMGVWKGRLSGHFPPGYSTPYTLETEASWVPNPGQTPKYYLRLEQTAVNIRPEDSGDLHWQLMATVPWSVDYETSYPDSCTAKTPCRSSTTPAMAAGRYEDAAHSRGVAVVVPTQAWMTSEAYLVGDNDPYVEEIGSPEVFKLRYLGAVLQRPLAGLTGFRFQWYICAGPWSGAQDFAQKLGH
jgi:hypothetical protein